MKCYLKFMSTTAILTLGAGTMVQASMDSMFDDYDNALKTYITSAPIVPQVISTTAASTMDKICDSYDNNFKTQIAPTLNILPVIPEPVPIVPLVPQNNGYNAVADLLVVPHRPKGAQGRRLPTKNGIALQNLSEPSNVPAENIAKPLPQPNSSPNELGTISTIRQWISTAIMEIKKKWD